MFLLDQDFRIERPKRYYRQGFGNLLHHQQHGQSKVESEPQSENHHQPLPQIQLSAVDPERMSMISSIKSKVSKIFHLDTGQRSAIGHTGQEFDEDDDSSVSIGSSRPATPMLDPSTNTNPLEMSQENGQNDIDHHGKFKKIKDGADKISGDVSKHTFYIVNSQMRLKLSARNEVSLLPDVHVMFSSPFMSSVATNVTIYYCFGENI